MTGNKIFIFETFNFANHDYRNAKNRFAQKSVIYN